MSTQQLIETIQQLPEALQREVGDYVSFLKHHFLSGARGEDHFWTLLTRINWDGNTEEEQLEPLVTALSESSAEDIYAFQDRLFKLLYDLDGPAYWEKFSLSPDGGSADTFLYARCYVVAQGKKYYQEVEANPTKFPQQGSFASLLFAAHEAYRRKTGEELERTPRFIYETGFNETLWGEEAIKL